MRVIRVLVYDGDERWIRAVLDRSLMGRYEFGDGRSITSVTVREIPANVSWRPWLRDKYQDIKDVDEEDADFRIDTGEREGR